MDLTLSPAEEAFATDVRDWLAVHLARAARTARFDTVAEEIEWGRRWQATMAAASPVEVALYNMEYARAGAPQPVNRVGINLAGPTLLARGTEEQQARWLPSILDASEIWCQLFSEPDAGSDLASLRTRAEPVDGGWLVTGQKVWTSYAAFSKWGIALVRTDPDAPKHRGLSYLVIDMESAEIQVRPLRQITDESEFNEVFLDEVFVPENQLVGGLHQGWAVANTTLAHERGTNFPFKEQVVHEVYLDELVRLARRRGRLGDPLVADAVSDAFVQLRLLRLQNWRTLSALGRGEEPGPESSVVKLTWTDMTQHLSTLALTILGDEAPLWPPPAGDSAAGTWQRQWLWSKSASIAGGTSEIQRSIIGERLLGLPRG